MSQSKKRIAINGFGRIGRMVLRAYAERIAMGETFDFEIIAINDLGSLKSNAHLFKYDSVHGTYRGTLEIGENMMNVGAGDMAVIAVPDPLKLPWDNMGIDIVFECSGRFTKRVDAALHLEAGSKRVLVSAPAEGADLTVVYGVNHTQLNKDHFIVSNASCTTNCLAPLAFALHKTVGIEHGFMTTIHSYTGDQRLVDTLHSDMMRARAAALSMIPSTTGAAKAVGLVLPELKGKLDGTSIRVPTPNVSVVDFKFRTHHSTTIAEVNDAVMQMSQVPVEEGGLKDILGVNIEPLVSCDFNGDARSSVFDCAQTQVIDSRFVRVLSWYDNEWGFSNRMLDVAQHMTKLS